MPWFHHKRTHSKKYLNWTRTLLLVDKSLLIFFRPTGEGLQLISCYSNFGYLNLLQRYWKSRSKVVRNRVQC